MSRLDDARTAPSSAYVAYVAAPQWPAPLSADALHGVAGDIVRTIEPGNESDPAADFLRLLGAFRGDIGRTSEPETESAPAAILVQLLVAFGNVIGRSRYWTVEGDRHYGNENVVLVGESGKGRKGTSWGHVRNIVGATDHSWTDRVDA